MMTCVFAWVHRPAGPGLNWRTARRLSSVLRFQRHPAAASSRA
jgi:hypothetical protein